MITTKAALYLPISDRLLGLILDGSETFEQVVAGLAVPQIAALILLQYLPKLTEKPSLSLDRILIEAIKGANAQARREGLAAVSAGATRLLNRAKIREGYELLAHFHIAL